jgi:xylitol oxidase
MAATKNWAGNYEFKAETRVSPTTVAEVQQVVRNATKVKAQGTRHSFNDIADSSNTIVSTENLREVRSINPEAKTVTIDGGVTYGQLCAELPKAGLALPNLASLPHISVAGAIASGSHGSGEKNGNLATSVVEIELVNGAGDLITLRRGDPDFPGAVVNLGALGVVTSLTLQLEDSFNIRQDIYLNLPVESLYENFDAIQNAAYSVSLFTDWKGDHMNQVWLKSRDLDSPRPQEFFGASLATRKMHPIAEVSPENCTDQLGVPGPWSERLAHFKLEFTPSHGAELQSEYILARTHVIAALTALTEIQDEIADLLLISEIRTIAADDLWLSPNYQQDSVAVHFTWQPRQADVLALLPKIEAALGPFAARPHWGKLFVKDPSPLYPRWNDFVGLAHRLDPTCKFQNGFTSRLADL